MLSARPHFALVTCDAHPALYADEQELPARFRAAGIDATPVSWSDAGVDWRRFDRVVVRSPWDYFQRIAEFTAWLDRMEREQIRLCNPLALLRWNLDKRYLAELAANGVRIVPTRFLAAGERVDLAGLVRAEGFAEGILKPAISGGSHRTHRFAAASAPTLQAELDDILRGSGALVQPFAPEIASEGEWSLVFFGGVFSHAALKTPTAGDFRVQTQFGGGYHAATAPPAMVDTATAIVARLPARARYVRIDGIRRDGELLLMEVEAIEPYLFLPYAPDVPGAPSAIDRYVAAIASEEE